MDRAALKSSRLSHSGSQQVKSPAMDRPVGVLEAILMCLVAEQWVLLQDAFQDCAMTGAHQILA